jgi:hypothetical protein
MHSSTSVLAGVVLGGDDLYVIADFDRINSLQQCFSNGGTCTTGGMQTVV